MGFMVGRKYEAGGIAKDGAKMVMAVANANVSCLSCMCIPNCGLVFRRGAQVYKTQCTQHEEQYVFCSNLVSKLQSAS